MSLAQVTTASQYDSTSSRAAADTVSSNGGVPSSNDFLTMMMAQIKHQNPLNPIDGTEYLSQLGMMSAVESLEGVKMGMNNLNIGITNLEMLQSTSLVGKKVLMESNGLMDLNENQTIDGRAKFEQSVDKATVLIYDEKGELVDKVELGPQGSGICEFQIKGSDLGRGEYSFEVVAEKGDTAFSQKMLIAADVESVSIPSDGGAIMLSLKGLGVMSMYDMREISI